MIAGVSSNDRVGPREERIISRTRRCSERVMFSCATVPGVCTGKVGYIVRLMRKVNRGSM